MTAHRCRTLVGALCMLTFAASSVVAASPASAFPPINCHDGDNLADPVNITDICYVSSIDVNQQYVAVLTGTEDAGCQPARRTYHTQRVRVTGDWISGGKFRIRSISIRYLSGTRPWAYYYVRVLDGNGQSLERPWNNYGNPIPWDGAGRDVDNVTTLVPPSDFAPVFGRSSAINIAIRPSFFNQIGYYPNPGCFGEQVVVRLESP